MLLGRKFKLQNLGREVHAAFGMKHKINILGECGRRSGRMHKQFPSLVHDILLLTTPLPVQGIYFYFLLNDATLQCCKTSASNYAQAIEHLRSHGHRVKTAKVISETK